MDNAQPPRPPMPAGMPVPPPPAQPFHPPAQPTFVIQQPRRGSLARRIVLGFGCLVLAGSLLINLYLIALLAAGLEGKFTTTTIRSGRDDQVVAIYDLVGIIDGKAASQFTLFCREIIDDSDIQAVVLRVESPGGGVGASDRIHHQVQRLQAKGKTVVVSMGSVAASGGYYVSASAHEILAEPTTVTGSIGVIMAWPVMRGTLEKIGVEPIVLKSTHADTWKDEGSWIDKPTALHRKHLQKLLDDIQEKFETIVRNGRGARLKTRTAGLDSAEGDVRYTEIEPLNGKVYLADEALELGLIDRIGYLSDAADRAAKLAKLDDPKILRYQIRRGLLTELLQGNSAPRFDLSIKTLDEFQTPRILLMWKVQ